MRPKKNEPIRNLVSMVHSRVPLLEMRKNMLSLWLSLIAMDSYGCRLAGGLTGHIWFPVLAV